MTHKPEGTGARSRTRSTIAGTLTLGLAATTLAFAGPATAAGPLTVTPSSNPDLSLSCGLDVVLVLDQSLSIATSGNAQNVKDAAGTFLTAFKDTNSRVGIVRFSTLAKDKDKVGLTYDNAEAIAPTGVLGANLAKYKAQGQTNWEDALKQANAEFAAATPRSVPKLIVFVTDGQPNTYDVSDGVASAQLPTGDPLAVDPAVTQANLFKAGGGHLLAVGVGTDFNTINVNSIDRLSRISEFTAPQFTWGSQPGSTTFDASTTDYVVQPDFTALGTDLRKVANQVCGGSLRVTQAATGATHPKTYGNGGAGWSVTTSVLEAPGYFVVPTLPSATTTATVPSNVGGTSVFQWAPPVPSDIRTPAVSVTIKPNYVLHGVRCTLDGLSPTIVAVTTVGSVKTFHPGTVSGGHQLACTVYTVWTGPLATTVSLSPAAKTLAVGHTKTTLAGIVRSPLKVLAKVKVTLWSHAGNSTKWVKVATLTTSTKGKFTRSVTPTTNRSYRVTYAGISKRLYPGVSHVATLKVAPRVTAKLTKSGSTRHFTGTVTPKSAGSVIVLQRLVGKTYVTIKSTKVSSKGTYSFTWTGNATKYHYRAKKLATSLYAAAASWSLLG